MILIIAEKPSLARNIVAGIGDMKKINNGWFEGLGYIVTWAFGHLFSLYDIEDYYPTEKNPNEKVRWEMKSVPCFPETFKYKLRPDKNGNEDEGVRRQFENIKRLCLRDDVDTIVNAGDADREGEIIVRLCVQNAFGSDIGGINYGNMGGKQFKRLWLPDQTPETVRTALTALEDEIKYNTLAGEGFARTYIDWLYGINLTRYATIKSGRLLRVGRVIVPVVKAIYDRDMQIRNFVPDVYYAIVSNAETNGCEVLLKSKEKFDKNLLGAANALCEKYNNSKAIVTGKKTKKDKIKPGKLYSLSKLQNVLGKKYKMPMDRSLQIVQKLYEAGYLTYPRTNSEYLATAEKDKVKKILEIVKNIGYDVAFRDDKSVFDDSKIESHSAITPTYKIPDAKNLSEDELKVYSTVMRRFAAVFCVEPCLAEKSEIVVNVGGFEDFTLKGTIILQKGWMKYDDGGTNDKILPKLEKGDTVNINFQPVQKETTPPSHYTIETLNNYLKNPFREEKKAAQEDIAESDDTDDAEEYKMILDGLELGTEATRTGIIENAIKSKYIELKKDVYYILPEGEFLINALGWMNITMDKYRTSEMGRVLKKVYKGENTIEESVEFAKGEIMNVLGNGKNDETDIGELGQTVGKCPLCGQDVVRTKFGYGCSGYKEGCKFSINLTICTAPISVANAKKLLKGERTPVIKGFVSKAGNKFDATLEMKDGKIEFAEFFTSVKDTVGNCPICGKPVVKTKFGYGCSGFREGCKFSVNQTICGRVIKPEEIKELIEKGRTSKKLTGFVSQKTGKSFDANLIIQDGKVVFDFSN